MANVALLALWTALTLLQAHLYDRGGNEVWMSSWWFLVYFLLVFGGNLAVFDGSALRRSGLSLLTVPVVAVGWVGALVFCAHVLGIQYG